MVLGGLRFAGGQKSVLGGLRFPGRPQDFLRRVRFPSRVAKPAEEAFDVLSGRGLAPAHTPKKPPQKRGASGAADLICYEWG